MQGRYIGLIVSLFSMLFLYFLEMLSAYKEVKGNIVVFFLLVLVFTGLGFFIGSMLEGRGGHFARN